MPQTNATNQPRKALNTNKHRRPNHTNANTPKTNLMSMQSAQISNTSSSPAIVKAMPELFSQFMKYHSNYSSSGVLILSNSLFIFFSFCLQRYKEKFEPQNELTFFNLKNKKRKEINSERTDKDNL